MTATNPMRTATSVTARIKATLNRIRSKRFICHERAIKTAFEPNFKIPGAGLFDSEPNHGRV